MSAAQNIVPSAVRDRYSLTLFDLAQEANQLTKVEDDARALKNALAVGAQLPEALVNPLLANDVKAAILAALAKKLKLQDLTTRFLAVLANNGRANALGDVVAAFLQRAAIARGAVVAEVASATEMSEKQLGELGAALSAAFGAPVDIEPSVKPEILGGLTVKVGSRLFDDSVKSKLDALKLAMKGA